MTVVFFHYCGRREGKMKVIILSLVLMVTKFTEGAPLTGDEFKITLDLIKFQNIRQLIFVKEDVSSVEIFNVKILSSQQISVMLFSEWSLMLYVTTYPPIHAKTMIVYKSLDNFERFTLYLKKLEAVSIFNN